MTKKRISSRFDHPIEISYFCKKKTHSSALRIVFCRLKWINIFKRYLLLIHDNFSYVILKQYELLVLKKIIPLKHNFKEIYLLNELWLVDWLVEEGFHYSLKNVPSSLILNIYYLSDFVSNNNFLLEYEFFFF